MEKHHSFWMRRFAWLSVITLLAGCTTNPKMVRSGFESELQEIQAQAEEAPETSETSEQDVVKTIPGASQLPRHLSLPTFDVAVDDTPLRTFLTGLVADSPINIVVHPEISGEVNLNLSGVTVVDVLEVLRDVYQLHMEVKGNLVRIMPNVIQTEVFTLDYVSVSRPQNPKTPLKT